MRSIVAFSLSFVLATIVGMLILPDARTPARSPLRSKPAAPTLDFLPAVPSFTVPAFDDPAKRYQEAWQLLRSGRYRTAERAYLRILIRNPRDQKAMQGLVTLQRFLANHDQDTLKERAQRFRLGVADRRPANERYAPREMELLAKASESASREIETERALKVTALSRISAVGDLAAPASAGVPHTPLDNAIARVEHRILKLVSSAGLVPGKPDPGVGTGPRPLPRAAAPRSGTTIGTVARPVVRRTQSLATPSPASGTARGDDPPTPRSVAPDPPAPAGTNSSRVTFGAPEGSTWGSQNESAGKDASGSGGGSGGSGGGSSGSGGSGGAGGSSSGGGKSGGADAGAGKSSASSGAGGASRGGKDSRNGKDSKDSKDGGGGKDGKDGNGKGRGD